MYPDAQGNGDEEVRTMRSAKWKRAAVALFVAAAASACEDRKSPTIAPAASSLAPSTVAPASKVLKFVIEPKGTSSIDMPAPKEHIKAKADAAAGSLDVDVTNLAASRGEVKIDLSTLTMQTFEDAEKNQSQTRHARTWLEVGDGDDAKLPEDVKKANRYAIYAIRSIEKLSAADLTKVASVSLASGAPGEELRIVTMTTRGEFLLHGHKVDKDVEIQAMFHYANGAPADKPMSVTISTTKPLHVVLGEHDVKPRDSFGKIAKSAFNVLGTKVADTANISLELHAKPQS
jgi:hypothetical protein